MMNQEEGREGELYALALCTLRHLHNVIYCFLYVFGGKMQLDPSTSHRTRL